MKQRAPEQGRLHQPMAGKKNLWNDLPMAVLGFEVICQPLGSWELDLLGEFGLLWNDQEGAVPGLRASPFSG